MRINLPLLLVVVLVAVGAYALYERGEFYRKSVPGPWSEAAQRNPFFAAQRYLAMEHVAVSSGTELAPDTDLNTDGTLILSRSTAVMGPGMAARLWRWIERGGHLIVAPGLASANDPLLAHVGVRRILVDTDTASDKSVKAAPDKKAAPDHNKKQNKKLSELLREYNAQIRHDAKTVNTQCPAPDPTDLTDVQIPGAAEPLRIDFSNLLALTQIGRAKRAHAVPKPDFIAANKSGTHLMRFNIGAGRLTVLSDIYIWTGTNIGEHDHVLLLDALIDHSRPVRFLYGIRAPTLRALLWRHAPETVIAAMALLLAWLVYRGRRFGPILDEANNARRASGEHWLAAARYQWQQGLSDTLLQAAREPIEQKAAQRFPGYAHWPAAEQLAALSAASAIPAADLQAALHAPATRDAERFRDRIAILQLLGNRL